MHSKIAFDHIQVFHVVGDGQNMRIYEIFIWLDFIAETTLSDDAWNAYL